MNTNKRPTNRSNQKHGKQEKNSSRKMRFFYVLMLLLIASSSVIRMAGASRHTAQVGDTPTPQGVSASGGGTAARVLFFHREGGGVISCADLVITATGDAVYSTCGNDMEKQYVLSDTERVQLQGWIKQFQPINYDHKEKIQTGDLTTQLYLNGQGNQPADDAATQQIIDFAASLATKIASQL